MDKSVLIASSRIDEPTYKKVSNILDSAGYPIVVYETDKVLSGEDQFTVEMTNQGNLLMNYNGVSILPERISAAWYRKIGSFDLPYKENQVAKRLYINNEVRQLHDMIWSLYPSDTWLSSPENMLKADRKLGQMTVAQEVGFLTPQTIISSDWESISKLFKTDSHLAIKMIHGVISDSDNLKVMYTNVVDQAKMEELKERTYSFPAYYQPYIEKAREWRITTVGDNVFPAAIYTDEIAKDDWRRHQTASAVEFKKEIPPDNITEGCISYIGKMGLRFGAFDFIEKPDGEIVFLECNPNGQYGWLEEELDLPISEAIASELMKIASRG